MCDSVTNSVCFTLNAKAMAECKTREVSFLHHTTKYQLSINFDSQIKLWKGIRMAFSNKVNFKREKFKPALAFSNSFGK